MKGILMRSGFDKLDLRDGNIIYVICVWTLTYQTFFDEWYLIVFTCCNLFYMQVRHWTCGVLFEPRALDTLQPLDPWCRPQSMASLMFLFPREMLVPWRVIWFQWIITDWWYNLRKNIWTVSAYWSIHIYNHLHCVDSFIFIYAPITK